MPNDNNAWTVDSSYLAKLEANRRRASKEGQAEAREAERTRIHKENQERIARIAAAQSGNKTDYLSEQLRIQRAIVGVNPDRTPNTPPSDEKASGTIYIGPASK
jgi:hypothetical protein